MVRVKSSGVVRHNNSTNINKQLSPAQNTPALQARQISFIVSGHMYNTSLSCQTIEAFSVHFQKF